MDESSLKERIRDKIKQIDRYLDELETFRPDDLTKYLLDTMKKGACERYIEKIAEAAVDLAILVVRLNKLEAPEDDDSSFEVLAQNNLINKTLAKKLKELKGMRNRLAHRYKEVDNKLVFKAVNEEIETDVREFISKITDKIRGMAGERRGEG